MNTLKMKGQRWLSILLVIAMMFSWVPTATFAEEHSENPTTDVEQTNWIKGDKSKEEDSEEGKKQEESNTDESDKNEGNSKEDTDQTNETETDEDQKQVDTDKKTSKETRKSPEEEQENKKEDNEKENKTKEAADKIEQETTEKKVSKDIDVKSLVEESMANTKKYYENNPPEFSTNNEGFHSNYWVFSALWGAGYKDLKKDFPWKSDEVSPWADHTFWSQGLDSKAGTSNEDAGIIIGSVLLGNNPYEFGKRNVVEDLIERQQDNGSFFHIHGESWAMIALDLMEAKYDQDKHIEYILSKQDDKGMFGDADATGWILTALAPHKEREDVKNAINKSMNHINAYYKDNNKIAGQEWGENSNAIASVIMGLAANGEDLTAQKWMNKEGNLVEQLINDYQQEDGSFKWQNNNDFGIGMATEQVLLALATVNQGQSIFVQLKDTVVNDNEESEEVEQEEDINYEELVKSTIDEASDQMLNEDEGIISEWQAIGLTRAGKEVPDSYKEHFHNHIERQITQGKENGRLKITDAERLAMAAVAIGRDPLDIDGNNLIALLYNSTDREYWDGTSEDRMLLQGNNGPIFALIALDTKGFSVPDDARWTRQKLVDELLQTQHDAGSWSLSQTSEQASIDITAMAIIGLSPYKDQPKVKKALDKAVQFLSSVQTDSGGFDGGSFVGGITSEAASQVIIGLTAYGIDPTSDLFTKNDINIIDHLLEFQADNGGFKHTLGESTSNSMATEQSLQGLVAYQLFMDGKGSLYKFAPIEDSVPPTLEVSGITDGEELSTSQVTFTVEANDDVDGKINEDVKLNGKSIKIQDDGTYIVNLIKGENEITVTAIDEAGNKTVNNIKVNYKPVEDTKAPTVKVSGIKDGDKTTTSNVSFTIEANDDVDGKVNEKVTLNGKSIKVQNGGSYVADLKKGENKITVTATDQAKNKTVKKITVNFKPNDAPVVIGDKKAPVKKDELLVIKSKDSKISNSSVLLPNNLPKDTKVTITVPKKEKTPYEEEKMELVGEWFDFEFDYPNDEVYKGTFELTLQVNKDINIEKAGIYHYDEAKKDWVQIDEEIERDLQNGTITVNVKHFSIYGVFLKKEEDPGDDSDNGEGESNGENNGAEEGSGEPDGDSDAENDEENENMKDPEENKSNGENNETEGSNGSNGDSSNKTDESHTSGKGTEGTITTVQVEPSEENGDSVLNNTTSSNESETTSSSLPNTATNTFNILLIGLGLLLLGSLALYIRKKIVIKS